MPYPLLSLLRLHHLQQLLTIIILSSAKLDMRFWSGNSLIDMVATRDRVDQAQESILEKKRRLQERFWCGSSF